MTRIISILFFFFVSLALNAQTNSKHTYVKGYIRNDGTYVQGHYRTTRNSTNRDNFTTKPNYNPYNGKPGFIQPDSEKKSTYSLYSYPSKSSSSSSSASFNGSTNASGQKVISYTNGQEIFGLCEFCEEVTYSEELDYYWYAPYAGVQKTQGRSEGTLLDGRYEFYNQDGNLLIKANFKKGIEHGDYIIWDELGNIKEKMHCTDGELDYVKFTNDDGYIIEWIGKMFAKGSTKNVYTSDGAIIESVTATYDLKVQYKIYYEMTGTLEMEFTKTVDDLFDGTSKIYYKNGKTKFIGHFSDNFRVGPWRWYHEDGTSESVRNYIIFKDTHPNGKLKVKGSQYYNHDTNNWIRDGKWIFYKENGTDWAETKLFENGIEVEETK